MEIITNHNLTARYIDEDALKIIQRLKRHGFSGYIVGGGVRDLLLGKTPKDFDIATDATPRKVKSVFSNSRIIGKRFRLVHVYFRGGKYHEVATFRTDSTETDNEFGTEETDAKRRDLTINGLFFDPQTLQIIDYVGGFRDIENKTIRIIGEPDQRFTEDPVRLLRTIRHAARTGFEIESKTRKSLKKLGSLIKESSPVRVYEEFKKDLTSGYLYDTIWLACEAGLATYLLPTIDTNQDGLFRAESSFSEVLRKLDEQNRGLTSVPHSVMLAALVFFLKQPLSDTTECAARFDSTEDIKEHIKTSFSGLFVTRRDSSDVENLLSQWLRISQAKSRVKHKAAVPADYYHDLQFLLTISNSVDLEFFRLYRPGRMRK